MPIIAYLGELKNPPSEEEWQQTMGKAGELCQTSVKQDLPSSLHFPLEGLFYHKIWITQTIKKANSICGGIDLYDVTALEPFHD